MQDKISVIFFEAHLDITCVVCSKKFYAFPSSAGKYDSQIVECPRCKRLYDINFVVEPVNDRKMQVLQRFSGQDVYDRDAIEYCFREEVKNEDVKDEEVDTKEK